MTGSSVISGVEDLATKIGPAIDDLVDIARQAGAQVATRRTIRTWVSQGLVSRPQRRGREWRYPTAAIGQVDTVARWRHRRAAREQIRFALFIETGTVAPPAAVTVARGFLERWEEAVAHEGSRLRKDPDALHQEAAKAAKMRGRAAPPHRVRGVSLDERTLAMTLALGEMFSVPIEPERADAGLHHLERILGMRSGRGGAARDLDDITLKPSDWPDDPAVLRAALAKATPERVDFARRGVEFAVVWMPAMAATFASAFGAPFVPLADILAEWAEKLTPDVYALMFALFIRNGFERATDHEIRDALAVFSPAMIAAAMLADRPHHEQSVVARRLRPYQRLQLAATLHTVAPTVIG